MAIVVTRIVVSPDGRVSLADPLPAGDYVASIEAVAVEQGAWRPIRSEDFPILDLGPWPQDYEFDRSNLYRENDP